MLWLAAPKVNMPSHKAQLEMVPWRFLRCGIASAKVRAVAISILGEMAHDRMLATKTLYFPFRGLATWKGEGPTFATSDGGGGDGAGGDADGGDSSSDSSANKVRRLLSIFSEDRAQELLASEVDDQEPTIAEVNTVGGADAAKWFEFTPVELKEPRIVVERIDKGLAVANIYFADEDADAEGGAGL